MNLLLYLLILVEAVKADVGIPVFDPALVRVVDTCSVSRPSKQVIFIKQWHLSPKVDSTDIGKSKNLPQYLNQKEIYSQIDEWEQKNKNLTLFAEGCSYPREISQSSPEKFNGWTVPMLSEKAATPEYSDIITNVAYKLKAKWKNELHAQCADNDEAIQNNQLAFSDARGEVGFLTRLEQYRNDRKRAQGYLDGVIEIYHLSPRTTIEQAISRLNRELRKSIDSIEKWIDVRNEKLFQAIDADSSSVVVAVFGGAHASGLKKLLEKKGIGCTIVEPVDYHDDESKILKDLETLVNQRFRAKK